MHPVTGRQDLNSPSEHYCMFQVGSLHGHRRRLGTRCLTPSLQAVPIPKIFDGHQGYTAAVMGVSAALQDRTVSRIAQHSHGMVLAAYGRTQCRGRPKCSHQANARLP